MGQCLNAFMLLEKGQIIGKAGGGHQAVGDEIHQRGKQQETGSGGTQLRFHKIISICVAGRIATKTGSIKQM